MEELEELSEDYLIRYLEENEEYQNHKKGLFKAAYENSKLWGEDKYLIKLACRRWKDFHTKKIFFYEIGLSKSEHDEITVLISRISGLLPGNPDENDEKYFTEEELLYLEKEIKNKYLEMTKSIK
jgi:hypothetical protein